MFAEQCYTTITASLSSKCQHDCGFKRHAFSFAYKSILTACMACQPQQPIWLAFSPWTGENPMKPSKPPAFPAHGKNPTVPGILGLRTDLRKRRQIPEDSPETPTCFELRGFRGSILGFRQETGSSPIVLSCIRRFCQPSIVLLGNSLWAGPTPGNSIDLIRLKTITDLKGRVPYGMFLRTQCLPSFPLTIEWC